MFCEHCGQQLDDGARYCIRCGAEQPSFVPNEPLTEVLPTAHSASAQTANTAQPPQTVRRQTARERQAQRQQASQGAQQNVRRQAAQQASPQISQTRASQSFVPTARVSKRHVRPATTPTPVRQSSTPQEMGNLALICIAIAVATFALTSGVILMRNRMAAASRAAEEQQTQVVTDDTDNSSNDTNPSDVPADEDVDEPEPEDKDSDEPTIRDGISDYSWKELAQIAALMEETCTSAADARKMAQDYHLLNADGTYPVSTKTFSMSSGKTVHMRLVGVWHDDADTYCGKAALSFLSTNAVFMHRANVGSALAGGWESSELREWLQTQVFDHLPDEVAVSIVPATKKTNNSGKTESQSSVSPTEDTLWVPSIVELGGSVNWEYTSNPSRSSFYNAVFNAEGIQYEAFAQDHVSGEGEHRLLALGRAWWLRSSAASTGRPRYVTSDGGLYGFGDASESHGVVFGFCL